MLDDYCSGQPLAYNILKNAIVNNKIAHAYLFFSDNGDDASSLAFCFAKALLCPNSHFNSEECENCTICHRIDSHNFPELKIINPEGLWIKKEQLLNLQEEFRMKPLEGNKKIYIINNAHQLNSQAANSILKFLEEPEPNIIAILTTSDLKSVLKTIVSRCQLIQLKNNDRIGIKELDIPGVENTALIKIGQLYFKNSNDFYNFINDAKNVAKLDAVVQFIKRYEYIKYDVLLETKKLWRDYFTEKEDYIWALEIMILFYKDVLNLIYHRDIEIFSYYGNVVEKVASFNNVDDIIHKLQKILLTKEKVKYNINLSLLIDKLIIEMESREHV